MTFKPQYGFCKHFGMDRTVVNVFSWYKHANKNPPDILFDIYGTDEEMEKRYNV